MEIKFVWETSMKKKTVIIFSIVILGLMISDYANIPSLLGIKVSSINWDFLNIILIIALYFITYKLLDKRTMEKEKNKKGIAVVLMQECYQQCLSQVNFLNNDIVELYIVPKINFNVVTNENEIIVNLHNSPFENENIIIDLVKDGQISKEIIESYFKIKDKYKQYINIRIIAYDGPTIYETIKTDLLKMVDVEMINLKNSKT